MITQNETSLYETLWICRVFLTRASVPEGNTSPEQKNPSRHSILLGNAEKNKFAYALTCVKNVCLKSDDWNSLRGFSQGFFEEVLYLQWVENEAKSLDLKWHFLLVYELEICFLEIFQKKIHWIKITANNTCLKSPKVRCLMNLSGCFKYYATLKIRKYLRSITLYI